MGARTDRPGGRWRLVFGALALAVCATIAMVVATPSPDSPEHAARASALSGPSEVARLFDGPLPALEATTSAPSITGDADADAHIRVVAEERGYRRRGSPAGALGTTQGYSLQPLAIADLDAMQQAMREEVGATLAITSAYRNVSTQRTLFMNRFRSNQIAWYGRYLTNNEIALGRGDGALDATLSLSAPPGYSKHHTGFAIDVRSGGFAGFGFRSSAAFRWLAEDDYANAMRFGWIPSYPDGGASQGPNPEPWEWVWIGREAAACARAGACASGGLDEADGRLVGWAVGQDGSVAPYLRTVTSEGVGIFEVSWHRRFDVAAATGSDLPVGFTGPADLGATEWVCVEARTTTSTWSRIGCLELD